MRLLSSVLVLALCGIAASAHAGTFQFSFGSSSSAFSGSGLLTTGDAIAPSEYYITAISGTARVAPNTSSLNIASLLQSGSFPTPSNGGTFPANDNVLFAINNAAHPDEYGFSFLVNGGAQINLFNDGPGVNALLLPSGSTTLQSEATTLSITPIAPTPEPSSLALLSTGLLGVAITLKRRLA